MMQHFAACFARCFFVFVWWRWGQKHITSSFANFSRCLCRKKKGGDNPRNTAWLRCCTFFGWGLHTEAVIWDAGPAHRDPHLLNTPAQHMSCVMLNNDCIDRQKSIYAFIDSLSEQPNTEDKCLQVNDTPRPGRGLPACKDHRPMGHLILLP